MDERSKKITIDDDDDEAALRAHVQRLSRDMAKAAATLSDAEVRFLVDAYYMMQDNRKAANNQILSMGDEPHSLIGWFSQESRILENNIKRALNVYAENNSVGRWMLSLYGVGPVIAAGMLAHIDINKAPTVGRIYSFAGLNPDQKWEKKQKRPWNAQLKTLCWKAGQCFMKFSGEEECVYGAVYKDRKKYEVKRNESGGNEERAKEILTEKNWDKKTDAYKALISGKLPQAHVDAQARRYAVKIFLSHLQCVWWFIEHHRLPPDPYAIAHKDHVDFIPVPNVEFVRGLEKALRKKGWL